MANDKAKQAESKALVFLKSTGIDASKLRGLARILGEMASSALFSDTTREALSTAHVVLDLLAADMEEAA